MKALFVIESNGEVLTFSRDVETSDPETLRDVLKDEGYDSDEVSEIFLITGELTVLGNEYID